jgi:endonuclease/exonuclease/phosphatase family metal-dependent hydrolase
MKKKALTAIATLGIVAAFYGCYKSPQPEEHILIATWNIRGYPETRQTDRDWFTNKLNDIRPDIICIQEIANQDKVSTFLANEGHFTSVAFLDSSDGQDNAIFSTQRVVMEDIPDPNGFQHPAQAAYVAYKGFDAVIVTIHLSWTDTAMREKEKSLLQGVVREMLKKDPDVIIVGDFNTKEKGIQELAESIGMKVMVPLEQDGVGTTHAGNKYDHFLISPDLASEEAVACQIQTFTGNDLEISKRVSDHFPVLAIFSTQNKYKDRQ